VKFFTFSSRLGPATGTHPGDPQQLRTEPGNRVGRLHREQMLTLSKTQFIRLSADIRGLEILAGNSTPECRRLRVDSEPRHTATEEWDSLPVRRKGRDFRNSPRHRDLLLSP